ncbi:MAG: hypothetical protein JWO53_1027, partial [Chlamydiia bacterium]|nr:hypothetical protein [Chlamydiia bacterium]
MKKLVLSGLIVLLPLAITYWIIKFLVNLITKPFENFFTTLFVQHNFFHEGFTIFSQEQLILLLSKIAVVVTLLSVITLIGIITHWALFHTLFYLGDKAIHNIPIVNKIYLACKDFTTAIFSPKSGSFSQVVLVPFPSAQHRSIGLI